MSDRIRSPLESSNSNNRVRALPKGKGEMGIAPPTYELKYEYTERGQGVVDNLRAKVARAEKVYLATDPDREGEAIAWHLRETLHLRSYQGVIFDAITEPVIRKSSYRSAPTRHAADSLPGSTARCGSTGGLPGVTSPLAPDRSRRSERRPSPKCSGSLRGGPTWNGRTGQDRLRFFTDEEDNFWLEQIHRRPPNGRSSPKGHDVAWEFGPNRRYTGRMLVDGVILTPSEATKKFFAAQPKTSSK